MFRVLGLLALGGRVVGRRGVAGVCAGFLVLAALGVAVSPVAAYYDTTWAGKVGYFSGDTSLVSLTVFPYASVSGSVEIQMLEKKSAAFRMGWQCDDGVVYQSDTGTVAYVQQTNGSLLLGPSNAYRSCSYHFSWPGRYRVIRADFVVHNPEPGDLATPSALPSGATPEPTWGGISVPSEQPSCAGIGCPPPTAEPSAAPCWEATGQGPSTDCAAPTSLPDLKLVCGIGNEYGERQYGWDCHPSPSYFGHYSATTMNALVASQGYVGHATFNPSYAAVALVKLHTATVGAAIGYSDIDVWLSPWAANQSCTSATISAGAWSAPDPGTADIWVQTNLSNAPTNICAYGTSGVHPPEYNRYPFPNTDLGAPNSNTYVEFDIWFASTQGPTPTPTVEPSYPVVWPSEIAPQDTPDAGGSLVIVVPPPSYPPAQPQPNDGDGDGTPGPVSPGCTEGPLSGKCKPGMFQLEPLDPCIPPNGSVNPLDWAAATFCGVGNIPTAIGNGVGFLLNGMVDAAVPDGQQLGNTASGLANKMMGVGPGKWFDGGFGFFTGLANGPAGGGVAPCWTISTVELCDPFAGAMNALQPYRWMLTVLVTAVFVWALVHLGASAFGAGQAGGDGDS